MSLTSEESRRLAEIDHELSRDCPELSRALSAGRLPTGRSRLAGRWLLLAAVLTLAVGIGIQNGPVCAAGWLGLLSGGLMLCVGYLGLGSTASPVRRAGLR
jgi:hypothetical protein